MRNTSSARYKRYRQKTVNFVVKRKITQAEYFTATFGAFLMFFRYIFMPKIRRGLVISQ